MTFHHHMGTVVETEREIDLLMTNTDASVGLLFDTGHLTFAEGDVLATRAAPRPAHQPRPLQGHPGGRAGPAQAEHWSFLKGVVEGVFTVPGDGAIDYGAVREGAGRDRVPGLGRGRGRARPEEGQPARDGRIGHAALTEAFRLQASRSR